MKVYLQIGWLDIKHWKSNTYPPTLSLHFLYNRFVWQKVECNAKRNIHLCIGHGGVLVLHQAVLLLAAVQTQTVVLEKKTGS